MTERREWFRSVGVVLERGRSCEELFSAVVQPREGLGGNGWAACAAISSIPGPLACRLAAIELLQHETLAHKHTVAAI